ncbi:MAG: SPFH domain-containing protein [Planctomycetota bacterium]|nr:SPFH domain-containing protein [Planctomycetota bacterium]
MKPERLFLMAAAAFAAAAGTDFGYALYSGSLSVAAASAIVAMFAIGTVRQFLRERARAQLEAVEAEAGRAAREKAAGRNFASRSFFEEPAGGTETEEERIARLLRESLAFQRRWGSPGLGLVSAVIAAAAGRIVLPRILDALGVPSADLSAPADPTIGMVLMLAQAFPALLLAKTCMFESRGRDGAGAGVAGFGAGVGDTEVGGAVARGAGIGGGAGGVGTGAAGGGGGGDGGTSVSGWPSAAAATIGHAATCWMWISLLSAIALMLARQGWPAVEVYVAALLAVLLILLGLEELVRFFWGRFGPDIADLGPDPDPAPWRSFLLHVLFARVNPLAALAEGLDREFGFKISESWPAMAVRRYAVPLIAGGLLSMWILSALVVVRPGEEAVVERFGRPLDRPPLGPGMHLIAPWPVDRASVEETGRVREIGVGFRKDIGAPAILWTRKHYEDECKLLVGGGDELISVAVSVQYRIKDIRAWRYSHSRPEDILKDAAHRELTRLTAIRTAGDLLTTAHRDLGPEIRRRLQKTADGMGIGVEIVFAGVASIHPVIGDSPDDPDVAAAYQDVVSAGEEKEYEARKGALYREIALPEAKARAARIVGEARGAAALRRGKAAGEAKRFLSRLGGFLLSPELYRTVARLEALEEALRDSRKILLDAPREGGREYWIDARGQAAGETRMAVPHAGGGLPAGTAPRGGATKPGMQGASGPRASPGAGASGQSASEGKTPGSGTSGAGAAPDSGGTGSPAAGPGTGR